MKYKTHYLSSLFIIVCLSLSIITKAEQPLTIMIDPSGDSQHTGHEIDDTFERGITLQCAEELKKQLNIVLPEIRIILTRVPGEIIQAFQNASFSNRLQADFYLSISFYNEKEVPSNISIFYYIEQQTDGWHRFNPLYFYHVQQAHLISLETTKKIGLSFEGSLKNSSINSVFNLSGLFGCPYKQLVGIKAPSIAIEVGICKKDDWKYLINPLTSCIKNILSNDILS